MKVLITVGVICLTLSLGLLLGGQAADQKANRKQKAKASQVTFKKDVFPIIKKYCLPCHTEDQMNPSELYLDRYENMMHGGKHGKPVNLQKPDSSLILLKLGPQPPFGDRMPYKAKSPISDDTLKILKKWIGQGAKNN